MKKCNIGKARKFKKKIKKIGRGRMFTDALA